MGRARFVLAGAVLALGFACGGGEKSDAPSGPAAAPSTPTEAAPAATATAPAGDAARAAAEQIFSTRCFTCHGLTGEGNGPGSANLMPPPRNFTDPAWQASVTDEHIAKIIQYGGAAVGKSPSMPSNPDLMSKPDVVQALVAHVRGLSAAAR